MFCRLNNYLPDTGGATFQSSGMLMTTVSHSPVATAELAALQRYQAIFPSTFQTYFHFQSCSLGHVVAVQKLDMQPQEHVQSQQGHAPALLHSLQAFSFDQMAGCQHQKQANMDLFSALRELPDKRDSEHEENTFVTSAQGFRY